MQQLLPFSIFLLLAFGNATVTITESSFTDHTYLRYSFTANPNAKNATGISIKGENVTFQNKTASAEGVGFTFVSPPNNNDNVLGFYFGYFTDSVSLNLQAQTVSVEGSLLEIVAGIKFIFIYYDRNGIPGLQYNLSNSVDCTLAPANADCFEWKDFVDPKSLEWGSITWQKYDCPAGYSVGCEVYIFTLATTGNDAGVMSISFKVASEDVTIDSYPVTPLSGKIDISINFPWSQYSNLGSNPKLGLAVGAAGKTTSGEATISKISNKPSVVFSVSGKIGSFSWEETATVTASGKKRSDSTVYYDTITGYDITHYPCGITCPLVVTLLTPIVDAWEVFGWTVEFVLFSWDDVQPSSVYWDPEIGIQDNVQTGSGNHAGSLGVGYLWLVVLLILVMINGIRI